MPTTYEPANADDQLFLEEVRDEYEPDLTEAETRVKLMFAFGPKGKHGELLKPAILRKGVRLYGEVKINNPKDRAEGKADATVWIDGDEWPGWSEARRRAAIHHELHHLAVERDAYGKVKTDDYDRPVMTSRPHDFEVGWFKVIADIHGADSFEVEQAARLADATGQLLWPWAPDADGPLTDVERTARDGMRKGKALQVKREAAVAASMA